MIKRFYYWLHNRLSKQDEREEYSAGLWQDALRQEALAQCRGAKGKLLEVGSGEGLFLSQLAMVNPGVELWGVDNSQERLRQAEYRFKEHHLSCPHFNLSDASKLPFEDEFFDAVVCVNVFFNMPSAEVVKKVLLEMRRVCKKGGTIIFDFRNARNPFLRLKYKLAPLYDATVKAIPLTTYHPKEIESMLRDAALRVTLRKPLGLGGLLFAPLILMKAERL